MNADLFKKDVIGRTALHYMVQPTQMSAQNNKNVVSEARRGEITNWFLEHNLVKGKIKIDAYTAGGVTPLMLAAKANMKDCVKQLLDAGANPFLRD